MRSTFANLLIPSALHNKLALTLYTKNTSNAKDIIEHAYTVKQIPTTMLVSLNKGSGNKKRQEATERQPVPVNMQDSDVL